MSLSALATVELQLIMQSCDCISLLALARCSRFTLASASADFAWLKLSPLPIHVAANTEALLQAVPSSLLRFCNLSLTVVSPRDDKVGEDTDAALFGALRVFELRLVWNDKYVSGDGNSQLLRCLQCCPPKLSSLYLPELTAPAVAAQCVSLIADRFTELQSLSIDAFRSAETLILLPGRLGSLRHLTLEYINNCNHSALEAVGHCAQLDSLALRHCDIDQVRMLLFLPSLRSLRSVTLKEVDCLKRYDDAEAPQLNPWATCFPKLRSLDRLSLIDCERVEELLEGLLSNPSALSFLLVRGDEGRRFGYQMDMPSSALLERLRAGLPIGCQIVVEDRR
jgi:hypothetical protein